MAESLAADWLTPPCVLLEDRLGGAGGLLYESPREIVRCDAVDGVEGAFRRLERGLAKGWHAAGFLAYELGYALEPRLAPLAPRRRATPLLWLGLFDPPTRIAGAVLDKAFARLGPPAPIAQLKGASTRAQHVRRVERALRLIEAGDIYQVNLTFPFRFRCEGDPARLYAALRTRQPVAHGGLAMTGERAALSVSPELWIETRGDAATTRPMKGTCARGADDEADRAARTALAADPKQRAENLMIVDLLRNDLARICVAGSVRAPALFAVETYPSFHALTSTVVGRLQPDRSLKERIAALFPCGSIVGAPKIRAAEIIRTLETSSRGVYSGALGAIAPNGDMTFNVAIRTAVIESDGAGRYDVGGGVVADSDPAAEYEEALLKARVLTDLAEDYGLIETLRWSPGSGFVRLDRHLDRLERSARLLGFGFDRRAAERDLLGSASGRPAGDRRIRLLLRRDGGLGITDQPLAPSKDLLRIGLAPHRLDPGDPFLRHKTTCRDQFERAFEAATRQGLDEVLFLNRRGEVSEASRNSVFVDVDGRLLTPPLAAGLLPGVLRQQLLDAGQAIEHLITPDLLRANSIWLGNSLHGLRKAELMGDVAP